VKDVWCVTQYGAHNQLPERWSKYQNNAYPYSLVYCNDVKTMRPTNEQLTTLSSDENRVIWAFSSSFSAISWSRAVCLPVRLSSSSVIRTLACSSRRSDCACISSWTHHTTQHYVCMECGHKPVKITTLE